MEKKVAPPPLHVNNNNNMLSPIIDPSFSLRVRYFIKAFLITRFGDYVPIETSEEFVEKWGHHYFSGREEIPPISGTEMRNIA